MRIYPVKENLIGSAVSEILRDRHKTLTTLYNRMVDIYLLAIYLAIFISIYLDIMVRVHPLKT